MMGIHFMGEVPFKKVYLHAMVRDEKGEKMSKTKGNVIDPLEWTKKYGSDSLRFTFAVMAGQGRDIKLSESRVEGYQAFCNKIWNAVKFLKMNWESAGLSEIKFEELEKNLIAKQDQLLPANAWILSRLQEVIQTSEAGFEKFEINLSAQSIYDFTWRELCDWAIEFSKIPLNQGSENLERRKETLYVLCYALDQVLKISHPIMPFVTEKLWQALPLEQEEGDSIMISKYPGYHKELQDSKSEHTIETVKNLINSIRNFRGENRVDAKKKFDVRFVPASKEVSLLVKDYLEEIQALAKITSLTEIDTNALVAAKDAIVPVSNPALELRISLDGLVDVEGETKRLSKEIAKVEKDIDHIQRKLSNKKFTERAPAELVEKETGRKSELESTLKDLSKAIERLKS
jgi:valyl-tRNA synthetase